ncbi:MAG: methyl-accepting chemotaxis protein, partial [Acetatifactor sp.]|nr:methyl-accepting chemotaxis protein [Acetatifactor sp.]
MEEMNELATQQALGKNSQAARFKKIIKQTRFSLILGVILLVLLVIASISYVRISQEELESAMALKQYRVGSRTLTTAVQSYAVTGDTQYYDAYMKELNVDKNRDTAWEILQNNDIKADEWAKLNEIAGLSNGLVPLEKEAMAAVAAGNTQAAVEFIFGSEYTETTQRISALTDDTIDKILDRLKTKKSRFLILEIICVIAFVAAFIRQAHNSVKAIRFSEKELLTPIIKVSEQMTALANGNLQAELDLEKDDSEVGNMVASIDFMKNNMTNMLEEMKKAADSAIRAEQAKSLFLSNMSH